MPPHVTSKSVIIPGTIYYDIIMIIAPATPYHIWLCYVTTCSIWCLERKYSMSNNIIIICAKQPISYYNIKHHVIFHTMSLAKHLLPRGRPHTHKSVAPEAKRARRLIRWATTKTSSCSEENPKLTRFDLVSISVCSGMWSRLPVATSSWPRCSCSIATSVTPRPAVNLCKGH